MLHSPCRLTCFSRRQRRDVRPRSSLSLFLDRSLDLDCDRDLDRDRRLNSLACRSRLLRCLESDLLRERARSSRRTPHSRCCGLDDHGGSLPAPPPPPPTPRSRASLSWSRSGRFLGSLRFTFILRPCSSSPSMVSACTTDEESPKTTNAIPFSGLTRTSSTWLQDEKNSNNSASVMV